MKYFRKEKKTVVKIVRHWTCFYGKENCFMTRQKYNFDFSLKNNVVK